MRLLLILCIICGFTPAPARAADYDLVGSEMVRLLQNGHYARLPFNRDLSARIFDEYLISLDPDRLYFLQSDVSELGRKYRRRLDELLTTRNSMAAASAIYNRYRLRVQERIALVNDLLDQGKFTFDSGLSVPRDRSVMDWAPSSAAAAGRWRHLVENLILTEEISRERSDADPSLQKEQLSIRQELRQQYHRLLRTVEQADEEDIANFFFSSVARAHDPHTDYFSARETDQFYTRMNNRLVGIGAQLRAEADGSTRVTGIVINGPADQAGELQLDDRIIAVDPEGDGDWFNVRFVPLDKVIEKIKGRPGTLVGLRLQDTPTREIYIERNLVQMKDDEASAELYHFQKPDGPSKIGVLEVPSFYYDNADRSRSVSSHVEKLVQRLKKEEMDALLIDMRGNGGGSLLEARRLTGLFTGRGPVVLIKEANGTTEALSSLRRKALYRGPLVVLVDYNSASATEIFAAALQDYNRAIIVGNSSTYGKGTVQTPEEISRYMPYFSDRERAGVLKYTIQKYYRPSGGSTQLRGVVPDLILPSVRDAYEVGERFERHALPFDIIGRAPGIPKAPASRLFREQLQARSQVRLLDQKDFAYIREDIALARKLDQENRISLDRKQRLQELAAAEERRNARNQERRIRFEKQEKADRAQFSISRLSLDDLEKVPLPPLVPRKSSQTYMRTKPSPAGELEETPFWPSGLDATKREALSITQDLVHFQNRPKIADAE